ncbi:MAG: hypothetical protein K2I53_14090, partial [Lachnospiraceae bacterium]|nr:hypothetical protein [Lachnospiraceae bacterium]
IQFGPALSLYFVTIFLQNTRCSDLIPLETFVPFSRAHSQNRTFGALRCFAAIFAHKTGAPSELHQFVKFMQA